MPMFELRVATMMSQQPSSDVLPAKRKRDVMPTSGTSPDRRPCWRSERVQGTVGAVVAALSRIGRAASRAPAAGACAAAATLGEQHDRSAPFHGQFQHTIGLRMIYRALGAGEHGVVVTHRDAAAVVACEQFCVDTTDVRHRAVDRELPDDRFARQARARRQHELAVLDERIVGAEIVDVLARRALHCLAALGHRIGPCRVQRDVMPGDHLGDIAARVVEVDSGRGDAAVVQRGVFIDERRPMALEHGVAKGHTKFEKRAANWSPGHGAMGRCSSFTPGGFGGVNAFGRLP